jgi:hypothetical protein
MKKFALFIGLLCIKGLVIGQSYLPITGGTLTGQLNGTSGTFSGNISVAGAPQSSWGLYSANGIRTDGSALIYSETNDPYLQIKTGGAGSWLYLDGGSGWCGVRLRSNTGSTFWSAGMENGNGDYGIYYQGTTKYLGISSSGLTTFSNNVKINGYNQGLIISSPSTHQIQFQADAYQNGTFAIYDIDDSYSNILRYNPSIRGLYLGYNNALNINSSQVATFASHVNISNGSILYLNNPSNSATAQLNNPGGATMQLLQYGAATMFWCDNGNVLIGKTSQINNSYKLDVAGNIRANKLVVNTTGADFVFDKKYHLRPLIEVEKFIKTYKHLPDISPAKEMSADGIDVGSNETKLLQKIEELTLYMITIQKDNTTMKEQYLDILKQNKQLKKRISKLENKN